MGPHLALPLSRSQSYGCRQTSDGPSEPITCLEIGDVAPLLSLAPCCITVINYHLKWVANYRYLPIYSTITMDPNNPETLLLDSEFGRVEIITIDQSDTSFGNRRFFNGRTIETLTPHPLSLPDIIKADSPNTLTSGVSCQYHT